MLNLYIHHLGGFNVWYIQKSKIVRKSDNLDNTKTKWFNGQKVKIKSGTSRSGPQKSKDFKDKNPTWFREQPLPVPEVEKSRCLLAQRWCIKGRYS